MCTYKGLMIIKKLFQYSSTVRRQRTSSRRWTKRFTVNFAIILQRTRATLSDTSRDGQSSKSIFKKLIMKLFIVLPHISSVEYSSKKIHLLVNSRLIIDIFWFILGTRIRHLNFALTVDELTRLFLQIILFWIF